MVILSNVISPNGSCSGQHHQTHSKDHLSPEKKTAQTFIRNPESPKRRLVIPLLDFHLILVCVYQNVPWSNCDPHTMLRSKNIPLKSIFIAGCAPQRTLTKDCTIGEIPKGKSATSLKRTSFAILYRTWDQLTGLCSVASCSNFRGVKLHFELHLHKSLKYGTIQGG